MIPVRKILGAAMAMGLLWAAGCASQSSSLPRAGASSPVKIELCTVNGSPCDRVRSDHYLIYSTLSDTELLHRLSSLMEGALGQYRLLAPDVTLSDRPLDCYIFETRNQWADFTKTHTGDDARIYLRVNRGGYTVGDWYVAYWIGPEATWSVAAHEGWHQFVARYLKGRLPPFLEEGTACLFEQVEWAGDTPRWNLSQNASRLRTLQSAEAGGHLYPLAKLARMHAGQIVGKPAAQIEAFYAESWAFARYLYDGDGGRNRPILRQMLADAAQGCLFDDSSREYADGPTWDPATAKPMLEHYLEKNIDQIDRDFRRYVEGLTDAPPSAGG